ncbi:hypothetical protein ACFX1X_028295 [Malus domestica]|uniref:RING-type domain-containing protein n=1 Tax=Malus domestica TaxID=3750 RepID=A0A498KLF7_MALDO|nr:hypothetical protein DVH24_025731 [Malus domestica]
MEYGDDAEDESENSEKTLATKLAYGLMCNHLLKMKTSALHIWMNTPKNSKIQTTCPHHFQFGCNNEWLAKNERWPICGS